MSENRLTCVLVSEKIARQGLGLPQCGRDHQPNAQYEALAAPSQLQTISLCDPDTVRATEVVICLGEVVTAGADNVFQARILPANRYPILSLEVDT